MIADSIESEFLTVIDRANRSWIPRLRLNLDDNDYFRAKITNATPAPEPSKASHRLIDDAIQEAREQVKSIVSGFDAKDHGDVLNGWISFMESRALAVLLRVPNDADAYRMFETLNDRGLRTSQSDLIKNYLLGRSGDRLQEVQQKWACMRGALETIEDDDITIAFLRHALSIIYGFVRETQVYETVQTHAKGSQPVITFANQLETLAGSYVAIHNAEHEKWNDYADEGRKALEVLNLFGIKPMRPLMLATAHRMQKREAEKAFQYFTSLCVRLMIAGSTRTGSVEEGLANVAHSVFAGDIATLSDLKVKLKAITPTNERFSAAFETATVSNGKLARYYLRSLELAAKGESFPWHIPNDDKRAINLEHILPEKTEGNWPKFSEDEVKLYHRRIGNMALLRASDNSHLKSASFGDKKATYGQSPYVLTQKISEAQDWTRNEIDTRQKTLAKLAVKAWPI